MVYLIFIWCLFSFFAYLFFIMLPLMLLGYITVPIAMLFKAYKKNISKYNQNEIYNFTWPFMRPWDNPEDGIYCTTYFDHGFFLTTLKWTLVRNPINGLRESFLACKIKKDKVRFVGSFGHLYSDKRSNNLENTVYKYDTRIPQWFLCWQGLHSCFYIQWIMFSDLYRFWIGTAKIYPTDIYGTTQYRKYGAGPVRQFKKLS